MSDCIAALISRIETLSVDLSNERKTLNLICNDKNKAIADISNECKELRDTCDNLRGDRDRLTCDKHNLISQVGSLSLDNKELTSRVNDLEAGIDYANDISADINVMCDSLRTENKLLTSQVESLCNDKHEFIKQVSKLEQQNGILLSSLDQMDEYVIQNASFHTENNRLTLKVSKLEEQCAILIKDNDWAHIRCDELDGLNTWLEEKSGLLSKELLDSKKAYNLLSQCEVSGKTTLELNEVCEQLREQCRIHEEGNDGLKALCDELTLECDNLTLELSKTKDELAFAKECNESQCKQIEAWATSNATLQEKNKQLEALVNTLEHNAVLAKENSEALTLLVNNLTEENDVLIKRIDFAESCNNSQCETVTSYQKQCIDLSDSIIALKEKNDNQCKSIHVLENRISNLEDKWAHVS